MRLCRDPLGELERSPDSLVAVGEGVLHTKGKGDGRGWREEKGREEKGLPPLYITSGCRRDVCP